MKSKELEFVERRNAAKDAKAALLEKAKARRDDPATQARQAARAAEAAEREERREAKRLETERLKREAQEQKQREDAEREARQKEEEEAARIAKGNDLVAKLVEDEAARKASRDARYAARQARKG